MPKKQVEEQGEKSSTQAFAYTPGLKIKESEVVEKERKLPILGEILVKTNDDVKNDTRVAQTFVPGDPYIVDAANMWGVVPDVIQECMLKPVGSKVNKGETIAKYTAFFGLIKKSLESPLEGTIETVSPLTGQIIITGLPVPVYIDAYVPGKVKEVMPREGAVIETHGVFIQGIFGIGGEKFGKLRVPVESAKDVLSADQITPDMKDCIIVAGSLVKLDTLRKAIQIGAAGIIGGGINSDELVKFMGYEIGVAITGEEEGITMIITEGFGNMNMHLNTFKILKKYDGQKACINGETQIRAGVIRPEVIIPHENRISKTGAELSDGMVSGTLIRIIREPYFGAIAKVLSLPVELQMMESGSYVRVLEAELENGQRVIVPRANVEIIEE
ncbi:hypothetical protein FJY84_00480 [Candidatus Bathyarchaeota archaeon]|nr:hypothetical protein [Candidatus Bathyarchaeota archaeon]